MNTLEKKSAFIAIIGRPNVGKSSLLNRILGKKITIVSKKPQTTRNKILGILTNSENQLVFIDTPGIHRPKNKLGDYMVESINNSISQVDLELLVLEAGKMPQKNEEELLIRFKEQNLPCILAINKIDLIKDKSLIAKQIEEISSRFDFKAIVPVSAKNGNGISALIEELNKYTLKGGHFFESDELTDQPERVITSEIIREKILLLLDKEVPHGIYVHIEKMKKRQDKEILDIEAVIYCEKYAHKGIIIGKDGQMIKKIGSLARSSIESFFDIKVNLKLWTKVKENWRNKEFVLKNFGYSKDNFKV